MRRFRDAVRQMKRTGELAPQHQWARILKGLALFELGEEEQATAAMEEARNLSHDPISDLFIDLLLVPHRHRKGETDLAQQTLAKARALVEKEEFSPYWVAAACFGAGRQDDGFEFLRVAFQRNEYNLAWLKMEPAFDSIQNDPRFQQLLVKMGLAKHSSQDT